MLLVRVSFHHTECLPMNMKFVSHWNWVHECYSYLSFSGFTSNNYFKFLFIRLQFFSCQILAWKPSCSYCECVALLCKLNVPLYNRSFKCHARRSNVVSPSLWQRSTPPVVNSDVILLPNTAVIYRGGYGHGDNSNNHEISSCRSSFNHKKVSCLKYQT